MIARLPSDVRGTAAVEMALVFPMLLTLMVGALELGNYFLSEHILIKSVRDGAVYAARQSITANYDCSGGSPTVQPAVIDSTKELVRTGELTGGTDRLPNWTDGTTTFSVSVSCTATAGGTAMGGMYTTNGGQAPVVTVSADLPYRSVLGSIGFNAATLRLGASEQAAAVGI